MEQSSSQLVDLYPKFSIEGLRSEDILKVVEWMGDSENLSKITEDDIKLSLAGGFTRAIYNEQGGLAAFARVKISKNEDGMEQLECASLIINPSMRGQGLASLMTDNISRLACKIACERNIDIILSEIYADNSIMVKIRIKHILAVLNLSQHYSEIENFYSNNRDNPEVFISYFNHLCGVEIMQLIIGKRTGKQIFQLYYPRDRLIDYFN
jgi:hypothetical protein